MPLLSYIISDDAVIIPPSTSFSSRQAREYQQLRNDGELIDFAIISQGKEFPCHRLILAASSTYFKPLVTSGMKESTRQQVTLDDIPPAVVALLLDHMYHNEVTISIDLLIETIVGSDYLHLPEVKEMCVAKADNVINPANVLRWWQLAKLLNLKDIYKKCVYIFRTSLTEVSKSLAFLRLGFEQVNIYLSDVKNFTVDSDDHLEATMDWIAFKPDERTGNIGQLIEMIQLMNCSSECIGNEINKHFEIYHRCPAALQKLERSLDLSVEGGNRKRRNKAGSIVIIGGHNEAGGTNSCMQLTDAAQLEPLCEILEGHNKWYGVCNVPGVGFAVSGGEGSVKCSMFWTVTKSWTTLRSLKQARMRHGSAFIQHRIFLFGGYVNKSESSSVVSLDPDEGEWRQEPDMPFTVKHPEIACAEINGSIKPFLLNTFSTTNGNQLIQMEIGNNQWIKKRSMPGVLCLGVSMIAIHDRLIVTKTWANNRLNHNRYSINDDTWVFGRDQNLTHRFGAMVSHRQSVFVIGGYTDRVEEYNEENDSWSYCDWRLPQWLNMFHALVLDL